MMRQAALLASCLLALAACASTGEGTGTQPAAVAETPSRAPDPALVAQGLAPAVSVIPESGIGPQTLEPRECALFLWSKTDASQFIFFQKAGSGTARMRIADRTVDVGQVSNRGEVFGQFMTEQAFLSPDGERVSLTFLPGEELEGGQRIRDGRLTVTADDSWRTVIPVLGVRACRP